MPRRGLFSEAVVDDVVSKEWALKCIHGIELQLAAKYWPRDNHNWVADATNFNPFSQKVYDTEAQPRTASTLLGELVKWPLSDQLDYILSLISRNPAVLEKSVVFNPDVFGRTPLYLCVLYGRRDNFDKLKAIYQPIHVASLRASEVFVPQLSAILTQNLVDFLEMILAKTDSERMACLDLIHEFMDIDIRYKTCLITPTGLLLTKLIEVKRAFQPNIDLYHKLNLILTQHVELPAEVPAVMAVAEIDLSPATKQSLFEEDAEEEDSDDEIEFFIEEFETKEEMMPCHRGSEEDYVVLDPSTIDADDAPIAPESAPSVVSDLRSPPSTEPAQPESTSSRGFFGRDVRVRRKSVCFHPDEHHGATKAIHTVMRFEQLEKDATTLASLKTPVEGSEIPQAAAYGLLDLAGTMPSSAGDGSDAPKATASRVKRSATPGETKPSKPKRLRSKPVDVLDLRVDSSSAAAGGAGSAAEEIGLLNAFIFDMQIFPLLSNDMLLSVESSDVPQQKVQNRYVPSMLSLRDPRFRAINHRLNTKHRHEDESDSDSASLAPSI